MMVHLVFLLLRVKKAGENLLISERDILRPPHLESRILIFYRLI